MPNSTAVCLRSCSGACHGDRPSAECSHRIRLRSATARHQEAARGLENPDREQFNRNPSRNLIIDGTGQPGIGYLASFL